jgi:tRNA threonylcarbamoyladenosine modification (KEOPS) complex  Pcc1 subunit
MHVRETVDAASTIVTLTTANSRISLGGVAGTINLTIAATDTANITPGLYVYDLELVSSANVVTRLIEGNFNVKAEVTR